MQPERIRRPRVGERHDPETHLIPLVLETASGFRPYIRIFGSDYPTPDGTAVRDYVHVTDLARGHVLAANHLLNGGKTLAVNLGSGRGQSVRQVIDMVRQITGHDVAVRDGAAPPGQSSTSCCRCHRGSSATRLDA